jgi:hypothetical protein
MKRIIWSFKFLRQESHGNEIMGIKFFFTREKVIVGPAFATSVSYNKLESA